MGSFVYWGLRRLEGELKIRKMPYDSVSEALRGGGSERVHAAMHGARNALTIGGLEKPLQR
jgi:hypothetical protein